MKYLCVASGLVACAPVAPSSVVSPEATPLAVAQPTNELAASTSPPATASPVSAAAHLVPEAPPPSPSRPGPRSERLPSGWYNPMPGGVLAGYRADTGLDIAGNRQPVFALASGTLDYAEAGHTLWTGPGDTAYTVRLRLDEPVAHGDRSITHVWYAHLSALRFHQPEGAPEPLHVDGGELLGVSGIANGSPHLHLGLLLDGEVEQRFGTYLLEDQVRAALGDLPHGARLPGALQPPLRAPAGAQDDWLAQAFGGLRRDG